MSMPWQAIVVRLAPALRWPLRLPTMNDSGFVRLPQALAALSRLPDEHTGVDDVIQPK